MKKYDVAAYIWPSYTGREPRSRMFWPEGIGEWQTVLSSEPKPNGYHWNRKPLWGARDEADPKVMEFQIKEALRHGVNVFIYDWYWYDRRPFLEQCLNEGFLGAENTNDMKFYLMWANHNANCLWDKRLSSTVECDVWLGSVDRTEFDRITDRIIKKYFSHPNYYRIDGKPVFMIYDVDNLTTGLGGIEETRAALEDFRAKTVEAGFPGLELQMTAMNETRWNPTGIDGPRSLSTKTLSEVLPFDSMTHYQYVHFADMNRDYESEILPDVAAEWERIDREYSIPYYPHVSIGWDNNPRFTRYLDNICRGNTPAAIEKALRMAKEYVDTHELPAPLITVNSWNEWTETSYLQPDDLNGYGYLEAIQRVFCK